MILAFPHEDEFARGHLGRMARVNLIESGTSLIRQLDTVARNGARDWNPVPAHKLIAQALELDPDTYLRQHTLLPFWRIAAKGDEPVQSFDDYASARRQFAFADLLREGAFLCEECIAKHLRTRNTWIPYWLCIHQLPGIDVCPEHGTPLRCVSDPSAFDSPPNVWLSHSVPVTKDLLTLGKENETILRFAAVAKHFLNGEIRVTRGSASKCLRLKMEERGIRRDIRRNHKTLSDCILAKLPQPWLAAHLPGLLDKEAGKAYLPIDDAWRFQRSTGLVYSLALAVLFDNADEAIHEFSLPEKVLDDRLAARRAEQEIARTTPSRDLLQIYLECEGNVVSIARRLDQNASTVSRRLRRCGLRPLARRPPHERQAALSFIAAASPTAIGASLPKNQSIERRASKQNVSHSSHRNELTPSSQKRSDRKPIAA